jgi:pimeloyl-ACP methyl ester carboxylesterase
MPFFKVNSVKLYFEIAGSGHPILLLTPLLQDHVFLGPFAEALAKKYKVISLDLLGHGLSDMPKDAKLYAYENLAGHCCQLMRHLKIGKHAIVGISWSGRIAITYTLQHQPNVRALILIDSSGSKQKSHVPPESPELSAEQRFLVDTVWKTPYDVTEELKKILVPTLIVVGDQDPRMEAARFMHERIPKSTLNIIEGAGHEADLTICASEVLSWLKKLSD